MDYQLLLGLLAATLTTCAFVPQLLKVWKSKSTHDISLAMYIVICAGVLFWLIYGLLRNDLPVIIANAVTLIIASMILFLKLKYR
jgi:MtN3 and saliva related transmembrane protein